jgi:hypothetical protein
MRSLATWPRDLSGTVDEVIREVLLARPASARRKAQRLRDAGILEDEAWLTWPLFDGIRDEAETCGQLPVSGPVGNIVA